MEFSPNRGGQQQQPFAPAPAPQRPVKTKKLNSKGMRVVYAILLIAVAIILGLIPMFLATINNSKQSDFVKGDKFQAVFLNGGQVYFGKIQSMNEKFLTMSDIYYLRVNEQAQAADPNQQTEAAQDISLAKLGCELHGPEDEMVINQEQVTFWENLKDDGQVTKAITEFVKANPDGQKCTEATS